jgi:hypothetical protein
VALIEVSWHLLEGTEENHENPQPGYFSWRKFEPATHKYEVLPLGHDVLFSDIRDVTKGVFVRKTDDRVGRQTKRCVFKSKEMLTVLHIRGLLVVHVMKLSVSQTM